MKETKRVAFTSPWVSFFKAPPHLLFSSTQGITQGLLTVKNVHCIQNENLLEFYAKKTHTAHGANVLCEHKKTTLLVQVRLQSCPCGYSSVVERHLAKVHVARSTRVTRFFKWYIKTSTQRYEELLHRGKLHTFPF